MGVVPFSACSSLRFLTMGASHTCEALVLKAYDIGEADRFCIFLTETKGRLPVCAKGVRKLGSKWGSAIQSFQHLRVDLREHTTGWYLQSAECLSSYAALRQDMQKFLLVNQGSELLLRLLHGEDHCGALFALTRDYFQCVAEEDRASLLPSFQLSLLSLLGLLPNFTDVPSLSPILRAFLASTAPLRERVKTPLSTDDRETLERLSATFLHDHLSFPLRSCAVAEALSSSTPTSSKLGRASY